MSPEAMTSRPAALPSIAVCEGPGQPGGRRTLWSAAAYLFSFLAVAFAEAPLARIGTALSLWDYFTIGRVLRITPWPSTKGRFCLPCRAGGHLLLVDSV